MKTHSMIMVSLGIKNLKGMVGAKILGYEPAVVPHLAQAAKKRQRPHDLSDIEIAGEYVESVYF